MPRRREVPKREVLPDPKFGDQQVSKFINMIMRNGKKSVAEKIVYSALDLVAERLARAVRADGPSVLRGAIPWPCAG